MAKQVIESTLNVLQVFDFLLEEPLEGLTQSELLSRNRGSKTAINRSLHTLVEAGWVESYPVKGGGKLLKWKISNKFLKAAHAHRLVVLDKMEDMKRHYNDISGEDI